MAELRGTSIVRPSNALSIVTDSKAAAPGQDAGVTEIKPSNPPSGGRISRIVRAFSDSASTIAGLGSKNFLGQSAVQRSASISLGGTKKLASQQVSTERARSASSPTLSLGERITKSISSTEGAKSPAMPMRSSGEALAAIVLGNQLREQLAHSAHLDDPIPSSADTQGKSATDLWDEAQGLLDSVDAGSLRSSKAE